VTSIFTSIGVLTSNSYSTGMVGSSTVTANMTSTMLSAINTATVYGITHCQWDWWNITVSPATAVITGTIGPSSASESFYILTPAQFSDFQSANSECGGYQGGEIEVGSLTAPYSLNWMNPPPGLYYVMFYVPMGSSSFPVATPFTLVAISSQAQTSTIYSVSAVQVMESVTQTITSLQTSQVTASSPLAGIPGFPWESILVGFLIGLAILLLKRSRRAV
jgi:hypothetical protein